MPIPVIAAVIGSALFVDGYVKAEDARKDAKDAQERQRVAQSNIQSEQRAKNAQDAQAERIRQRREFIRKQAALRQVSRNTGTTGSSGEFGGLSSLETGLSTNIGNNLGAIQSASSISDLAQANANAAFDFQGAQIDQQSAGSQMNLGMSLFSMGSGSLSQAPAKPAPTPTSGG